MKLRILLLLLLTVALCSVMAANVARTAVANGGMDTGRGGSRLARQKRDCNRSNCTPGFCLLGHCTAG
uniref:Alpha-conotoxin-like n=1 Tax=Globodera pallida TaxID=36090 RepID=A0A183BYX7_GLOPA